MAIKINASDFNDAIQWWEEKRLIYNGITLLGGILVVFLRSEVPNGISYYNNFWIILFLLFGANIFYTIGWAFEALLNYYCNVSFFNNSIRKLFFFFGTVFSFIWMFVLASGVR